MTEKLGKILVIDDDDGILLTLRILLRKQFETIVTEHTPQKITQLLSQQKFQVILLDMNFSVGATSGKEGFYWLQHIKETSPESSVVMMTAYGDIDLAIKAMKDGASDFVIKPWENDKLIQTLIDAYRSSKIKSGSSGDSNELSERKEAEEVSRVFMFLDIKSSTEIAERLGHVRYFNLLNDFFADISDPIHSHKGEIYQYVGDQVVVSWPLESGIADGNCINAFFHICDSIAMRAATYREKYGLVPEFKAGMHFGKVSTGSVGTIKKEIVFSGDVLNTAARIEGLCNRYQVNLLVSKELLELLPINDSLVTQEIGNINLRGKQKETILYNVQRVKQF